MLGFGRDWPSKRHTIGCREEEGRSRESKSVSQGTRCSYPRGLDANRTASRFWENRKLAEGQPASPSPAARVVGRGDYCPRCMGRSQRVHPRKSCRPACRARAEGEGEVAMDRRLVWLIALAAVFLAAFFLVKQQLRNAMTIPPQIGKGER